jgi:putative toxin-antitoxin system antitoxin component (TIGR02293 family)
MDGPGKADFEYTREAFNVMGGKRLLDQVNEVFDAHTIIVNGLPRRALLNTLDRFSAIPANSFASWLGVSTRTIDRFRGQPNVTLDVDVASRLVARTSTVLKAIDELGSVERVARWLCEPAIGLDRRKPVDLLVTEQGTKLVDEYLERMRYGSIREDGATTYGGAAAVDRVANR